MGLNRMQRTGALLTSVGVLAAGVAGCSSVADKVAEEAVGAAVGSDVDIDTDDDGVSVDTGNGEFSMESTAEVPAVVSDLLPVPDDFVAEGTQNVTIEDGEMTQVMGTIATDDPAAVLDEIEQALAADGFETTTNSSVGGEMFTLLMGKEGVATVTVAIIDDGDAGEPAEMNISVMQPAS